MENGENGSDPGAAKVRRVGKSREFMMQNASNVENSTRSLSELAVYDEIPNVLKSVARVTPAPYSSCLYAGTTGKAD